MTKPAMTVGPRHPTTFPSSRTLEIAGQAGNDGNVVNHDGNVVRHDGNVVSNVGNGGSHDVMPDLIGHLIAK